MTSLAKKIIKTAAKLGVLSVASITTLVASGDTAGAWETFRVSGGLNNAGIALNTNNNWPRFDTQPIMSSWSHNIGDIDQQFVRMTGNRGGTLLKHRSTGKCLNAHYMWNGANMNVWTCDPNDIDQNWNLLSVGTGEFLLRRTGSINSSYPNGLCVDSPYRQNGGKIHMWSCNSGNANQRWKSTIVGTVPSPSGQVNLPFGSGQTWYVCQGYQNSISHGNTFGLDLTATNKDFGSTGCWAHDGNANKSAGRSVTAPTSGTIYHVGQDLVCLSIDANRSLLIGHMSNRVASGTRVSAGQQLGTVSYASSINGRYAHIHLEGRRSSNCAIGTSVPLTAANGLSFVGVGDLPNLAGTNDHFKRALTRP